MRRKDREVNNIDEIIAILTHCSIIHLSMVNGNKPYSIPLNFGFVVREKENHKVINIYFHGAKEGKKIDILRTNPNICFSTVAFSEVGSLNKDLSVPCDWTTYYESVIGSGKVSFLEDSEEKAIGLDSILLHNGYKLKDGREKIKYSKDELSRVMVAKIEVSDISGKRHLKR